MDPLSAIGGASAVIGLIQSGFQFAQALHEYAKDVKKVPDEIIGLPDRLFESVGLVDEVNNLLTLNRQTHAWTELGVRRAEGDIVVCYEIITRKCLSTIYALLVAYLYNMIWSRTLLNYCCE